jgi:hypothetical protein
MGGGSWNLDQTFQVGSPPSFPWENDIRLHPYRRGIVSNSFYHSSPHFIPIESFDTWLDLV